MKCEVKSITPMRPNDVGDVRYEFRVVVAFGQQEENVDVTAQELTDFHQFQQIVLAKTGILPEVGLIDAENEFDAYRRWQQTLQDASWMRESKPSFDAAQSDDDADEPFYGFADN